MIVYIGSKSGIKIKAVAQVLTVFSDKKLIDASWKVRGERIHSRVPVTPYDEEVLTGASNRAHTLHTQFLEKGDLFVGLESALVKRYGYLFEECWCYMLDKSKKEFVGYSSGYQLPARVRAHLEKGGTHTAIMNILEQERDISRKDTWALYSRKIIRRYESIAEAFRNALSVYLSR